MSVMDEVILVDVNDAELGVMEKMEVHQKALLHRAFSVFIFNEQDEMLLQRRALSKYHSGGLWTNACCSHPRPGEETIDAAKRRLKEELGFSTTINKVFDFTYQAEFANGLTEHEFDHVYVGVYDGVINPDPEEVMQITHMTVDEVKASLGHEPGSYTAWFHIAFPKIYEWWKAKQGL